MDALKAGLGAAKSAGEAAGQAVKTAGSAARKSVLRVSGIKVDGSEQPDVEEEEPVVLDAETSFTAVAANLREALQLLEVLPPAELALGLYFLHRYHVAKGVKDEIDGQAVTKAELEQLQTHFKWVNATYEPEWKGVCALGGFAPEDIVKHEPKPKINRPAYYIATSAANKVVVLGIRGTQSFKDAITDIQGNGVAMYGGDLHAGMLASAKAVLCDAKEELGKLLKEHSDWNLHIVGHSLGAGTAAILALFLHNESGFHDDFPPSRVKCTALATPACMDESLAISCKSYITTIVYEDDIIPRLSLANLHNLQMEALFTNWQDALEDGERKKKAIEYIVKAQEAIKRTGLGDKAQALSVATRAFIKDYKPITPVGDYLKDLYLGKDPEEAADGDAAPDAPEPRLTAPPNVHFAPGRLIHLKNQLNTSTASANTDADVDAEVKAAYMSVLGKEGEFFRRIVLSPTMVTDHGLVGYNTALAWLIKNSGLETSSSIIKGIAMLKLKANEQALQFQQQARHFLGQ